MSDETSAPAAVPADGQDQPAADLLGFKPGAASAAAPPSDNAANAARFVEYDGARLEVPDQFWDKEAGTVNVGALLKSQGDLRKQLSDRPKPPENYELKVPEALADKVKITSDDPFAAKAMEWAKSQNLTQDQFDQLAGLYLEQQAGAWQAEDQAVIAEIEADIGKLQQSLGQEAGAKIKQLDSWLAAMVGTDEGMINAARNLRATADGTLFLMHLRGKMGNQPIPGAEAAPPKSDLTLDELRKMQQDPRYWKDRDPAFIKKVEEGYGRLYKD